MSVEIASIHPTRLELLKLRRRKAMAEGIVDILKKDLDALTVSLFELVKKIPTIQNLIKNTLREAYNLFMEAQMISSFRKIEEISLSVEPAGFTIMKSENRGILGILLPKYQLREGKSRNLSPRFNILDTPTKIDDSAIKIKVGLDYITKLAETEASIREILEVMSVKKRQMNRLQYKILPQLESAIRYIELILEETERQDAIRVRVLQRKRKERAFKQT